MNISITLKAAVQIKKPPEAVWGLVDDPELIAAWYPRYVRTVPISWGKPRAEGFRYRVTYLLGGRSGNALAEFIEYAKPERLSVRFSGGDLTHGGYILETYEFSRHDQETLLSQRIEVHGVRHPFISGPSIFIRHHIGKTSARRYMQLLKKMAEERPQPD